MRTEADMLDAESKFAKALNDLRKLRPFYSAIYESMERVEKEDMQTMGVSVSKMVYNKDFVERLNFNEFMFVNLHEIAHVALMHVSRRANRNPEIWNFAADLYVNRLLSDEFNIKPGQTDGSRQVKFIEHGLFCSSVDLEKDSTEDIYESMIKSLKSQGYTGTESDIGKEFEIVYTGSREQVNNGWYSTTNEDKKYWVFKQKIVFTGCADDIMDGDGDGGSDTQAEKEDKNKRLLYEAKTRYEMRKSREAGLEPGVLGGIVEEILKSHVDWRKLLRRYCIKATSTDSSFSSPDKRMYYQDAIYPGQSLDESKTIKGVKICFDSSGSISMEDISYYFGQVMELMQNFKIDAEVIYWDTEAVSIGKTISIQDITKKDIYGGGGTDPSCVFNYFDSKKCKIKPIVSLIFTDGFVLDEFNKNDKWKRRYKDTIWIMTRDCNKEFKPRFGTVTHAKYSE